MKRTILTISIMAITALGLMGCGGQVTLSGAGATFPYPLYARMLDEYYNKTGIQVNYEGIGSGGGIRSLMDRIIDFGGTDAALTDDQLREAGAHILHIPTCIGSVGITYNLPGNPDLKFSSDIIAGIYLGEITKWNDPKIAKLNPGISLPDLAIIPVHRSDGSGTTYVFTDYLNETSATWNRRIGKATSVNWPVSIGQKGNAGVSGYVRENAGAIGYVEFSYAKQNNMPLGSIKNKSGNFIMPTVESTTLASEISLPDDMRVSIVNTSAPQGYPITAFTWIIVYQEQAYGGRSKERAKTIVKLLNWIISDGQQYTVPLDYAPLSDAALVKAQALIDSVVYNGEKIQY
jgi:phosphate transport system substrate-binding protein